MLKSFFVFFFLCLALGCWAQVDVTYDFPFSTNIEGWWPEKKDPAKGIEYKVEAGHYRIILENQGSSAYTSANIKIYDEEAFSVQAEMLGIGGNGNTSYGLGLSSTASNDVIALNVNGKGEYAVSLWSQFRGWQTIKAFTTHKAIRKNKNTLAIKRELGILKFLVNGEQVMKLNLPKHSFDFVNLMASGAFEAKTDYVKVVIPERDIHLLPAWETIPASTRLSRNINTIEDESSPFLNQAGDKLYVSRAYWIEKSNGQLGLIDTTFVSDKQGDDWSKLRKLEHPFNQNYASPYNTFPDGNTFLASKQSDPGALPIFKFCLSHKTQTGWSDLEELEVKNLQKYLLGDQFDGFVCADGKTILFTLSPDSANALTYLYASFLQGDGSWSEPKSLGNKINKSGYRQGTAFLAADMKTLFFTSNGHKGYGGFDLFMSKRLDDSWTNWSEPYNLGPNINSQGSEMYFSIPASGEYGLYVMDKSSYGERDVWKVKLPPALKPEPVVLVKGHVLEDSTNLPLSASVSVVDLATDQEVGVSWTDPKTGGYEIILQKGHSYRFNGAKDGYFPSIEQLDLSQLEEYGEVSQDLFLTKMATGKKIRLKNLLFVQSKAEMLPESLAELDHLLELLTKDEELKVMIEGHTDNTGSYKLNKELSQERADVVREYLIDHGIKRSRLKSVGHGSSKPLVHNRSEKNRQLNRRVEFSIME